MGNDALDNPSASAVQDGASKVDATASRPWVLESELAKFKVEAAEGTDSPVPFFHLIERLKLTKRAGWQRFGIKQGESISDHMYRMSILTMLAPPSLSSRINIPHCTKMALIHDMAESIVGDITPVDGVDKAEKSRREAETMDYLCQRLLGGFAGGIAADEIRQIWQEYEDNETIEAKYVHDIDKMELILQMVEYERANEGRIDLGEFAWVATRITLAEVKAWADAVLEERVKLWQTFGKQPSWPSDWHHT